MNAMRSPEARVPSAEGRSWPVGLIRADRIGRVRSINPAARGLLGMLGEHAAASSIFALLAPAEPALGPRTARELAPGGAARATMHGPGGARVTATLARDEDGGLTALLVDDGAAARAEAEAERCRARFEALADCAPRAAVWALDPEGRVSSWPRSAERQIGLPRREALGMPLAALLARIGAPGDAAALLSQAEAGDGARQEAAEVGGRSLTLRAARDRDGRLTGFVAVCGEIGVAASREAALRRLAAIDPLTGLLNRRAFFDAGDRALGEQRRAGGAVAVVAFDLDRFKALNDALGHAAGDKALQLMADAARAAFAPTDVLGRLGGDEFAVIAAGASRTQAVAAAERLGRALAAAPGAARLTASFGVVAWAGPDETLAAALARADAALYRAKAAGRDRVALG